MLETKSGHDVAGPVYGISLLGKTVGEILTEVTEGANLVDGKQVWEWASRSRHKHDLPRCNELLPSRNWK